MRASYPTWRRTTRRNKPAKMTRQRSRNSEAGSWEAKKRVDLFLDHRKRNKGEACHRRRKIFGSGRGRGGRTGAFFTGSLTFDIISFQFSLDWTFLNWTTFVVFNSGEINSREYPKNTNIRSAVGRAELGRGLETWESVSQMKGGPDEQDQTAAEAELGREGGQEWWGSGSHHRWKGKTGRNGLCHGSLEGIQALVEVVKGVGLLGVEVRGSTVGGGVTGGGGGCRATGMCDNWSGRGS